MLRPIYLHFIIWSLCHLTLGVEEGTCSLILYKELYIELVYALLH